MMSSVMVQEPILPLTSRNYTQSCRTKSRRPYLRWGEYDVTKNGRDCRQFDGLSRLRNNFDCCHELPVFHDQKKFEDYISRELNTCRENTKRRVPQPPRVDVFPMNKTCRQDNTGEYILTPETRNELQKNHEKLYCTSRYGILYPEFVYGNTAAVRTKEQTVNSDRGTMFSVSKPNKNTKKGVRFFNERDDGVLPAKTRLNYHLFITPQVNPSQPQNVHTEKEMTDTNKQANDILVPNVYNYRIPSALHYPDYFLLDLQEEPEKDHIEKTKPPRFLRPLCPACLHEEVASFKKEIQHGSQQMDPRPCALTSGRKMLPNVDNWINSSVTCKLKLSEKSDTQKRHVSIHSDKFPDLRNFHTYSKRVCFNGFNSSAFRG